MNKVEPESPTVPHVTGLNCESVCCGSVKLTWNPPGVNTRNTLVFYREKAAGQPCPPFSFTESTLFTQNLGINRTAAIITGLEVGKEYCFYVIPIGLRGNPPDNLDVAPFCSTTVADCAGCLINISASELSFDPEYENWNSGNLQLLTEDALEILSIQDGNPNTCAEIYGSCDPLDTEPTDEGWQFWWDPAASNPLVPEPNTIFINFDTPKELSAVYAQDWNGRGNILIEYESCDCPDVWFKLTTLNLEGKPYCHADGSYETIHVPIALKKVSKLKITKLSNDGTIRRLYFCGSDTDCGPQPPDPVTAGDPTNFRADEIRKNTAVLKWTAGSYDQSDPATDRMEAYTVALSQNVDSNNELVNPVEYTIQASPYEMDVFYRLSGLAPGTTYFADLRIRQYPCHTTFPGKVPLRTSFTTDSEEVVEREKERPILRNEKTDDTFKVILTPNPASDNVRVRVTKGEIDKIVMIDNYGRQIETFSVNGQNVTTLSLEGHPPGIYWLRVIRTNHSNLTVLMVKTD
ncbi:MAG: T9SS C-terminal target domain-containing protein [Bacteroidetes bacterium]|nr:MAG: T9SS C-terminal target domain-containing protein [Bacteroidota bacterium]